MSACFNAKKNKKIMKFKPNLNHKYKASGC